VAYLPITRAIMTAHDPATIQDASKDVWQLTGSDLLVLADREWQGGSPAYKIGGLNPRGRAEIFRAILNEEDSSHWWFGSHHLYQTFVQPVYFGSKTEGPLLGFLIIGYEIDDRLAREVSTVSASQVAFSYGDEIVATTLTADQAQSTGLRALAAGAAEHAPDVEVGKENFVATSLDLSGQQEIPVRLTVLGSYDQAAKFLDNLNRLLLLLGLTAVLVGSALVFLISYTFTRPLASSSKVCARSSMEIFIIRSTRAAATKSQNSRPPSIACAPACSRRNRHCSNPSSWPPLAAWPVRSLTIYVTRSPPSSRTLNFFATAA
jgi:hypothetical protein